MPSGKVRAWIMEAAATRLLSRLRTELHPTPDLVIISDDAVGTSAALIHFGAFILSCTSVVVFITHFVDFQMASHPKHSDSRSHCVRGKCVSFCLWKNSTEKS